MTAKDYKLIASVLREAAAQEGYEISTLVEMFAHALQRANPNFDSERFARAVYALRESASRTQGKVAQQFDAQRQAPSCGHVTFTHGARCICTFPDGHEGPHFSI